MKRLFITLSLGIFVFINSSSQEVRGVETRRIIYEGEEYSYGWTNDFTDNKYYGWEFTNRNSITISLDIELWAQSGSVFTQDGEIVKTKTVILKPRESYVLKREEHCSTKVSRYRSDCDYPISNYYTKYKAYKLQ